MAKHTPGPWRAEKPVKPGYSYTIWANPKKSFSRWVCTMKLGEAPVEEEPTAMLIAAAPEMYDLLKAFVKIDDYDKGRLPMLSNQGQAMDGYTKLASYEELVNKARRVIDF